MKPRVRKHLCIPGLLTRLRSQYCKISDLSAACKYSLTDCLMSGLAIFGLKYSSLLKFDDEARFDKRVQHNLQTLYGIAKAPCDTYLRERLDVIEPKKLQQGIQRVIAQLQRAKILECYRYWDEHLLVAIDGTEYFSSHEIQCENCCVKNHRDGSKTYYHQMLAATIVNPNYRQVFPLMLEPILKQDGATKNDCEHKALKRLLHQLRLAHPHAKLVVTLDGLYADGVIINLLKKLNIRFIITASEKDLKYCYEFYHASKKQTCEFKRDNKEIKLSFANGLPINETYHETEVNLLYCEEVTIRKKKGKSYAKFAWITDLPITEKTAEKIMKGARARWRIENETFNTLKNQGYQFEHNFGHGYKNLNVVMTYLMITAFLIDQIQEFACKHFQSALKNAKRLSYLWERMRHYFFICFIDSWAQLYDAITGSMGFKLSDLVPIDSS